MISRILFLLILMLPVICPAQDEDTQPASVEVSEEPEEQARDGDGALDRHKELVDTQVQRVAQWVDWMEQPMNEQLLDEVQQILRPIHNWFHMEGRPENNDPLPVVERLV